MNAISRPDIQPLSSELKEENISKPSSNYTIEIITIDSLTPKTDTGKILTISDKVGDVIDKDEKAAYHLFPFWKADDFVSAQFIQMDDGAIYLVGRMKDGSVKKIPYSKEQYSSTRINNFSDEIENEKLKEEEKSRDKKNTNKNHHEDPIIKKYTGPISEDLKEYYAAYNKAVHYNNLATLFFIGAIFALGIPLLLAVPFAFIAKKNAKLALKQELDASHLEEKNKLKRIIRSLNSALIGFGILLLIVLFIGHFVAQTF